MSRKIQFPRFMKRIGKVYKEQGRAIFTEIPSGELMMTMEFLKEMGVTVINGITGNDTGEGLEVLYHIVHKGHVLTIKVKLSRDKPSLPTVTKLFPSALLFEQETHEMLGVDFPGNSKLNPILLADSSPKTPLKKKLKDIKPPNPGGSR